MPTIVSRCSAPALALFLAFTATACASDQLVAPSAPRNEPSAASNDLFSARAAFARYVAIGTSISAGVQSDGLTAAAQVTSWPALLDAMVGRALKQPYISGTGCHAPVIAPLLLGIRLSGESVLTDAASLSCAPLLAGLAPPFDNVSLNGALTTDALLTTPQIEAVADKGNAQIYARVLQPGKTQVTTMVARNATMVSIELGSNEVLAAISGIDPNVPVQQWAVVYDQVLSAVPVGTKAVVVGLIDDVAHVPAFRTGDELWNDQFEFGLFHVSVAADCHGSPNLVFVPFAVAPVAAAGLVAAQHGLPPVPFSCAPKGGADFILTPSEASSVNSEMHAMDLIIQTEANARHFAYFPLGALYDRSDLKGQFSLVKLMTSASGFGSFFSLDGVHPNGTGQAVLARAAAQALNTTYGLGIPIL